METLRDRIASIVQNSWEAGRAQLFIWSAGFADQILALIELELVQAKQEGIKEAVEWLKQNLSEHYQREIDGFVRDGWWIPDNVWQAKLKEWNLEA